MASQGVDAPQPGSLGRNSFRSSTNTERDCGARIHAHPRTRKLARVPKSEGAGKRRVPCAPVLMCAGPQYARIQRRTREPTHIIPATMPGTPKNRNHMGARTRSTSRSTVRQTDTEPDTNLATQYAYTPTLTYSVLAEGAHHAYGGLQDSGLESCAFVLNGWALREGRGVPKADAREDRGDEKIDRLSIQMT